MKRLLFIFLTCLISLIILSCSQLELIEITSKVNINTGTSLNKAISDITSFKLTITANDMETVEKNFDSESISVEVLSGEDRTFTLEAYNTNSEILYKGSSTVTLIAGEDVNLIISMESVTSSNSSTINSQQTSEALYVSSTGSDSNDGTKGNPYLTIENAIDAASSSGIQTIFVASGTYSVTEPITLADGISLLGGYDENNNWSRDITSNTTIIDSILTNHDSTDYVFYASDLTNSVTVEGFTINATMDYDGSYAFYLNNSSISVSNNIVNTSGTDYNTYHIYAVNSTLNIVHNQFYCTAFGSGYSIPIYLSSGATAVITNNIIEGENSYYNGGGCVNTATTGTYDLTIRNNTIVAGYCGGYTGGVFGTRSSCNGYTSSSANITLRIDNNIITTDNTSSDFFVIFTTSPNLTIESFKNNIIYTPDSIAFTGLYKDFNASEATSDDTTYSSISELETAITNASGNLNFTDSNLFTDSANNDYTFGTGATTTITKGGIDGTTQSPIWSFTDDVIGTTRTGSSGTGWSIGAYEQD
ncbi:MAG: hypothetical protein PQJ46_06410 [Spirochaetales bacterium]|nr:hypothetical protein [Spirochaetales bacterium]